MRHKTYYIDSCVFVDFLFKTGKKAQPSINFFKSYQQSADSAKISTLTIMETITSGRQILAKYTKYPEQANNDRVINATKFFFALKNLEIIPDINGFNPLSSDILDDSLRYINKYTGNYVNSAGGNREHDGLYAPDCIHLSFAIKSNCDTFITRDNDFNEVSGKEPIKVEIL